MLRIVTAVMLLASVPSFGAVIWAEVGDAGGLTGTAQATTGGAGLMSITGTIGSTTDADMFLIYISSPAAFSATTVGTAGTLADTQLFLFDAAGLGIYANDDNLACACQRSMLPAGNPASPTAAGWYYLVISGFDIDPNSVGGLIFPTLPFDPVYGPTGPGGGSPISSYTGTLFLGTGTYTINLTGADAADVPEPATAWLMGGGLTLAALLVRKRKRS